MFIEITSKTHRYGFNGKELDAEGMGGGQSTYDYGFRIYNPAIARFLSVDPLTVSYPYYTPYQFAGNTPVWAIDVDGLEPAVTSALYENTGIRKSELIINEINTKYDQAAKLDQNIHEYTRICEERLEALHDAEFGDLMTNFIINPLADLFTSAMAEDLRNDAQRDFEVAYKNLQNLYIMRAQLEDEIVTLWDEKWISESTETVYNDAKSEGMSHSMAMTKATAHLNSYYNFSPHHMYEIYDVNTGEILEVGISGRSTSKDSDGNTISSRAQEKIRTKYKDTSLNLGYRVIKDNIPGRLAAAYEESLKVQEYKDKGLELKKQYSPKRELDHLKSRYEEIMKKVKKPKK